MKRLLISAIAVCLVHWCHSQTDFRKAYVITNSWDTLVGLINNREGALAYQRCDFKISESEDAVAYEPGQIIGYGFPYGKFFQSRDITLKHESSQTAFLEVLVKGYVSLYRFESTYFIEKDGEGMLQLINESREAFVDGRWVTRNSNEHIAILNMLLFDCQSIRARIRKMTLSENPLTNLVEDYNRCHGTPYVTYKSHIPWLKPVIGLVSGINVSGIEFSQSVYSYYLSKSFEEYRSPLAGLSLNVSSPRLSNRLSFTANFLYLHTKYYGYNVVQTFGALATNYLTIDLRALKIPIGVRYTFPQRRVTPFLNAGLSSTYHLSSASIWIQEVEWQDVVETFSRKTLKIGRNQIGAWGGLGGVVKLGNKLNGLAELRYEKTNGLSWGEILSKVTNIQIIVGLQMK